MVRLFDDCTVGRSTDAAGAENELALNTGRSSSVILREPSSRLLVAPRVMAAMARMSMSPEPSGPDDAKLPPRPEPPRGEAAPASLLASAARLFSENRTEFSLRCAVIGRTSELEAAVG